LSKKNTTPGEFSLIRGRFERVFEGGASTSQEEWIAVDQVRQKEKKGASTKRQVEALDLEGGRKKNPPQKGTDASPADITLASLRSAGT